MRVLIDMQGAQSASRFRGIGRYTLSFAKSVVMNRGRNEVFLALNGLLPESITEIRAVFSGLLPPENIRVWDAPGPVREGIGGNEDRRRVAETLREAFFSSLRPDVIHLSSLFEGEVDNAVTSIGDFDVNTPVTTAFYDLIPALNPAEYLDSSPVYARFYRRKLGYLERADGWFAISEFAANEGREFFPDHADKVCNVSTAIDDHFSSHNLSNAEKEHLEVQLRIKKPFLLYTGGGDQRKNLPRLIKAFHDLPDELRDQYQLVLAGRMPEVESTALLAIARQHELDENHLVLTGYVSEADLVSLYNACQLFVFPSWHEGFGIPPLEAMKCGAPVIASNTSSLPEVVGLKEALFDPFDVQSMTAAIERGLTDADYRSRLIAHGAEQARQFSWDNTAARAWSAWESIHALRGEKDRPKYPQPHNTVVERLAPLFKKAPELHLRATSNALARNNASGLLRQLLVDISEVSQRDAATGVQRVVKGYLRALLESPPDDFVVRPVYSTGRGKYYYANQYTAGFLGLDANSATDDAMAWQRGDIFFALDMQHDVQLENRWFLENLRLDGVSVQFMVYDLLPIQLPECFENRDVQHLHEHWLRMIGTFDGAICISQATANAYSEWLAGNLPPARINTVIDSLRLGSGLDARAVFASHSAALNLRNALGNGVTFLTVSTLEPRKGQPQIFAAVKLLWQRGVDVNLIFVGRQGWGVDGLANEMQAHPELGRRLHWLQGIGDDYLDAIYQMADCLVYASLNEGFGLPLVEAAHHGKPLVLRDIPVFREVAGDGALYFSGRDPGDLADTLQRWSGLYKTGEHPLPNEIDIPGFAESAESLKLWLVKSAAYRPRQLLVDVSELVQQDAGTGIQRVVRNILREWLINPPSGCHVEPVYATEAEGYHYARSLKRQILGLPQSKKDTGNPEGMPIDVQPGDLFLGLDLQPQVIAIHRGYYQWLRQQGVTVKFVVYDLLQLQMPQYFPVDAGQGFALWLDIVAENDGAVCISKAVASQLRQRISDRPAAVATSFDISWFHLGADLDGLTIKANINEQQKIDVETNDHAEGGRFQFLMVGTLEPRKGHAQVLSAFELLWGEGLDLDLVIVGKAGWMVEELVEKLDGHDKSGTRLFWYPQVDDTQLEAHYHRADALLAASEGEGFGLPLVEAAMRGLPVIARDLPVFREVAGSCAFYFGGDASGSGVAMEHSKIDGAQPTSSDTPAGLAAAVKNWLELYERNQHPSTEGMPILSWSDSAAQLAQAIGLEAQIPSALLNALPAEQS